MRLTTNQREVEIEVESMDSTGCAIGNMWVGKGGQRKNVGTELLLRGFASVYGPSAARAKCVPVLFVRYPVLILIAGFARVSSPRAWLADWSRFVFCLRYTVRLLRAVMFNCRCRCVPVVHGAGMRMSCTPARRRRRTPSAACGLLTSRRWHLL